MEQKCSTCKKGKQLEEFYRSKREKLGHELQCKSCASDRHKKQREQIWQRILDHYGRQCVCCNEKTEEFLTVDHINKNGAEQRRKINRGRIWAWIVRNNFPGDYRILCMNCNFAIGMYGYCPHKQ